MRLVSRGAEMAESVQNPASVATESIVFIALSPRKLLKHVLRGCSDVNKSPAPLRVPRIAHEKTVCDGNGGGRGCITHISSSIDVHPVGVLPRASGSGMAYGWRTR